MPKTTKLIVQRVVQRDDLWWTVTRNLRKYCDSVQTSIAWNAVQLFERRSIESCVAMLWEALTTGHGLNEREFLDHIRAKAETWGELGNYPEIIMRCAFRLFLSRDWNAFLYEVVAYVEVDQEEKAA